MSTTGFTQWASRLTSGIYSGSSRQTGAAGAKGDGHSVITQGRSWSGMAVDWLKSKSSTLCSAAQGNVVFGNDSVGLFEADTTQNAPGREIKTRDVKYMSKAERAEQLRVILSKLDPESDDVSAENGQLSDSSGEPVRSKQQSEHLEQEIADAMHDEPSPSVLAKGNQEPQQKGGSTRAHEATAKGTREWQKLTSDEFGKLSFPAIYDMARDVMEKNNVQTTAKFSGKGDSTQKMAVALFKDMTKGVKSELTGDDYVDAFESATMQYVNQHPELFEIDGGIEDDWVHLN